MPIQSLDSYILSSKRKEWEKVAKSKIGSIEVEVQLKEYLIIQYEGSENNEKISLQSVWFYL